jgi:hypothetical protein
MPLRDHFHSPLADRRSWEGLHGAWPGYIAEKLVEVLPPEYYCSPRVHLGTVVEIDLAAFEEDQPSESRRDTPNGTAVAWKPTTATLLYETETPVPAEYEVRVYDEQHAQRLVAAVEIVSPSNKDRPESREAFVAKCQALLMQHVCVAIVDVVTERSTNLFALLADRIGAERPEIADAALYAVSCRVVRRRKRTRFEMWPHALTLGEPLPTPPLWLTEDFSVPLELEASYEKACRLLRIG